MILSAKPELLLLIGLPASGKSTRAREWQQEDPDARIIVNYDSLRIGMFGPDWRFNRKEENQMKAHADGIAQKALNAGLSVVIDNTNLTDRVRQHWRDLAKGLGATVAEEEIDTPVAECIRRDRLRTNKARVGQAVIDRMALFHGFINWQDYPNQFVVCDIDGTLSDPSHRLHLVAGLAQPKDWDKFHDLVGHDTLKEPIARLLRHFRSLGYHIIICSGRWIGDRCGKDTEDWLHRNGISYDHLFMRQSHDSRPDVEIKGEILDLLPIDKIAYVIDDRPQVLRMWQAAGLTTLAVGDLKEF